MNSRSLILSVAVVLAAAVLAGCRDDDKKKTSSPAKPSTAATAAGAPTATPAVGQTVKLSADPSGKLAFVPKTVSVSKPGTVSLVMTNPSSARASHAIEIEGNGIEKKGSVVLPGGTSIVTVELKKAGTYELYCPVGTHKQQGMTGELTVGGAKTASAKPAPKPQPSGSGSGDDSSGGDSGGGGGGGGYGGGY
jgi:uncharacterized cupredoxin-like copper-binding protein